MMRLHLFALAAALSAAPLAAQQPPARQASEQSEIRLPAPQPQAGQQTPAPRTTRAARAPGDIPPELSDPRLASRLVDVLQVLSKSFLDLPVGEAQAALEGRKATSAERKRTVRSESGMSERELRQTLDQSRPMMEASFKALIAALPAMMSGMGQAQRELERSTANIPRPDYPKK